MQNKQQYDVTVLVITYNPRKNKLIKTLNSILLQKNVKMQVVIADDGSENNYFDIINDIFRKYNFVDYELIGNKNNNGTTLNFYSGLKAAKGTYLKGISPGDYLYSADTLSNWITFMKENALACSFGDAVYYRDHGEEIIPFKRKYGYPIIPNLYNIDCYNENAIYMNCFVLEDYILGASYFCKTQLILKYIDDLLGRVKYLEDGLYRIMLLDHVQSIHYPKSVIVYEYGTGVSTTTNSIWKERVDKDKKALNDIVLKKKCDSVFFKHYCEYLRSGLSYEKGKRYSKILKYFPGAFAWKIYKKMFMRFGKFSTSIDIDKTFMKSIGDHYASY